MLHSVVEYVNGQAHVNGMTLFYRQATMHRGLPFEVRVPNPEPPRR